MTNENYHRKRHVARAKHQPPGGSGELGESGRTETKKDGAPRLNHLVHNTPSVLPEGYVAFD